MLAFSKLYVFPEAGSWETEDRTGKTRREGEERKSSRFNLVSHSLRLMMTVDSGMKILESDISTRSRYS